MTADTKDNLTGIVQLEECPAWRANELLAAGYKLLGFMSRTTEQDRRVKPDAQVLAQTFIRHDFGYIVGRTAAQEPFPARKPREPRSEVPA
ncbi:MAG TPA: hypothetical protein VIP09_15985 [Dehalococcoidia bacterium]|jgi:hypothetical protein